MSRPSMNQIEGCQNAPSDNKLRLGDLVKTASSWHIVSKLNNAKETDIGDDEHAELTLTSLADGNVWKTSGSGFPSQTTVSELERREPYLTIERHIQRGHTEINLELDEDKAYDGEQ